MRAYLPFVLVVPCLACGGLATGGAGSARDAGGADVRNEAHVPARDAAIVDMGVALDTGMTPAEGGACAPAERAAIWAKMDTQPIVPNKSAALLDLMPTRAEAESVLCVGHDLGDLLKDGTRVEGWGDMDEVQLDYDPATGAGIFLRLSLGYTGACDFAEPTAAPSHAFDVVIRQQVQRDGIPFEINWDDASLSSLMEIYNGQMYSFGGPGIYTGYDTGNCSAQGLCVVVPPADAPANDNLCIFGIDAIRAVWAVTCPNDLQPTVSTIARVDLGP